MEQASAYNTLTLLHVQYSAIIWTLYIDVHVSHMCTHTGRWWWLVLTSLHHTNHTCTHVRLERETVCVVE